MALRMGFPPRACWTRVSANARSRTNVSSASAGIIRCALILPHTCTTISTSSNAAACASNSGQGWVAMESSHPSSSMSSSIRWGAIGAKSRSSVFTASNAAFFVISSSLISKDVMPFKNSIHAAIAVLKWKRCEMSLVTRPMAMCVMR